MQAFNSFFKFLSYLVFFLLSALFMLVSFPLPLMYSVFWLLFCLFLLFSFFIKFKSLFFLPGKIQEVIVCTHFPWISVSPFLFSPPSPSVSFLLTSPCRTSILPSGSREAEWPHLLKSELALSPKKHRGNISAKE